MVSRPARTLGFLLALGVLGVLSLGYVAQRYTKVLEGPNAPALEARRDVDRFIKVRRGMRLEIDGWNSGQSRDRTLTATRDRALLVYGMNPENYVEVRRQYRAWRAGTLGAGMPLAAAFEQRRDELRRLDLGDYESLDG